LKSLETASPARNFTTDWSVRELDRVFVKAEPTHDDRIETAPNAISEHAVRCKHGIVSMTTCNVMSGRTTTIIHHEHRGLAVSISALDKVTTGI
jgi:hypothetical protein